MEGLSQWTMMVEAWKEKTDGGKEWALKRGGAGNRIYLKRNFDKTEIC